MPALKIPLKTKKAFPLIGETLSYQHIHLSFQAGSNR